MKYKIMNDKTFGKSIKDVVLENRGLIRDDVEKLLNADRSYEKDCMDIFGMSQAVDFFEKEYNPNLIIGLNPDTDVDGYTSSSILYKFLRDDLGHPVDNIRTIFQSRPKAHGMNDIVDDMVKSDVDLFIIADSSTNDLEEQRKLIDNNKQLIILDHHIKENDAFVEGVYLVNNQIGESSNKHLAGVGVVIKFIQALGFDIDKYMDTLAVGLIADSMDMLDYQNRYYVNEGLSNTQDNLIKAFFAKSNIENPTITDVSFNAANYINAVIRYGKEDEKDLLWRVMIGEEGTISYTNKKKEVIEQSLVDGLVRVSNNVKTRQNNAKKKAIKLLNEYIYTNRLDKDKCIIVKNDNMVEHSLTGAVAMSLCNNFKRPIIILSPYKGLFSGSMRSNVDNFKTMLIESRLVENAQGHEGACGVDIEEDKIQELRDYLNIKLKDFKTDEKVYDVDYVFNAKDLNLDIVKEIGDLDKLWCSSVKEPMFAIKGITLESKDMEHKKGFKGYVTKFKYKDMFYNKNFSSKDTFEKMARTDLLKFGRSITLDLTLIVKFRKNEKGFFYIDIVDFNSVKSSKKNNNCYF